MQLPWGRSRTVAVAVAVAFPSAGGALAQVAASPPTTPSAPGPRPAPGYSAPTSPYAPGGYPLGHYPPPGYPPPGQPMLPAGYHQHDGFFAHLAAGVVLVRASTSRNGTASATGRGIHLAFGGSVAPNLILFAEPSILWADGLGIESPIYGAVTSASVLSLGLGQGLAYYVEPLNLYLSGTFTYSAIVIRTSSSDNGSANGSGFGARFAVGKEWWTSTDWAVGLAGTVGYTLTDVQYYDEVSLLSVGLLVSVTLD
jgi:hypothetical protein